MSSAEVARWCGYKSRPFSYLYTSGSHALLTTTVRPADQRRHNVTLALWIKVQTSSAQGTETELRGCVKVEVAVMRAPSLIVRKVCMLSLIHI